MTLPDLTALTDDDLRALLSQASSLLEQRARDDEATEADLRIQIGQAIASLDALIGPDDPTAPALDSITEVQLYSDTQMAQAAGLAHRLTFVALERLSRTVRDIARIAGA